MPCFVFPQLTPIERYAMNFLEASLEDICKEELKQAEVNIRFPLKYQDNVYKHLDMPQVSCASYKPFQIIEL